MRIPVFLVIFVAVNLFSPSFCRKKAEAIVKDALSETIFNEETKDRAGSLPPFKYVKDYSKHEYMEIPEPGDLAKHKALSTGRI